MRLSGYHFTPDDGSKSIAKRLKDTALRPGNRKVLLRASVFSHHLIPFGGDFQFGHGADGERMIALTCLFLYMRRASA